MTDPDKKMPKVITSLAKSLDLVIIVLFCTQ